MNGIRQFRKDVSKDPLICAELGGRPHTSTCGRCTATHSTRTFARTVEGRMMPLSFAVQAQSPHHFKISPIRTCDTHFGFAFGAIQGLWRRIEKSVYFSNDSEDRLPIDGD